MVRSMLVTACRLATSPTRTSPDLANATTDGVVRAPSALGMTVGSPPSRTATTLFVVPRSMPTARAMVCVPPGYRVLLQRPSCAVGASLTNKLSPFNSTLLTWLNGGLRRSIPGSAHESADQLDPREARDLGERDPARLVG